MYGNNHVLILNKSWSAIGTTTIPKAMNLLFSTYKDNQPKAIIVDASQDFRTFTWSDWSQIIPSSDDQVIRTPNKSFKIPEIILLTRYTSFKEKKIAFSRRALFKRDNFSCQYCGCMPGTSELTIDHIIPRSWGGKTTWDNCVLCCIKCNYQKADRIPVGYEHLSKAPLATRGKIDKLNWIGPSPMKLLESPKKPKHNLFKSDRKVVPKSWNNFLSEVYWDIELEE